MSFNTSEMLYSYTVDIYLQIFDVKKGLTFLGVFPIRS
jgi:hypothetical protein